MLHVLLKAITIYHEYLFVNWNILSQLRSLNLPEEFFNWPVRTSLSLVVMLSLPCATFSAQGTVSLLYWEHKQGLPSLQDC